MSAALMREAPPPTCMVCASPMTALFSTWFCRPCEEGCANPRWTWEHIQAEADRLGVKFLLLRGIPAQRWYIHESLMPLVNECYRNVFVAHYNEDTRLMAIEGRSGGLISTIHYRMRDPE